MTITKNQNGDTVTLLVDGRLDTNTSPEMQAAILEAFKNAKNLVLDLEKVVYVSSAGLRALLIGQKTASSKGGKMEVIHVAPTVKSVFNSVGFSKILNIR